MRTTRAARRVAAATRTTGPTDLGGGDDWTYAYARHRKDLQLIGLNDPEKRWVLKNPSHLDALMHFYPDALIVRWQTPPPPLRPDRRRAGEDRVREALRG